LQTPKIDGSALVGTVVLVMTVLAGAATIAWFAGAPGLAAIPPIFYAVARLDSAMRG
jgi:hypothetical protein